MKKLFTILMVSAMVAFVACGPSAEEKAAAEQAKLDSISALNDTVKADSTIILDTTKKVEEVKK